MRCEKECLKIPPAIALGKTADAVSQRQYEDGDEPITWLTKPLVYAVSVHERSDVQVISMRSPSSSEHQADAAATQESRKPAILVPESTSSEICDSKATWTCK